MIISVIVPQHSIHPFNRRNQWIWVTFVVLSWSGFWKKKISIFSSSSADVSIATRKEWKKRKELLATSDTYQEPLFEDNIGAVPFDNFETIGTTALVDVDKLYGDYVNELTAKRRRRQGPDALCLNEFEMNLRKYRIIGGIYCIEYFDQPPQHTKHSSNLYLRTSEWMMKLKYSTTTIRYSLVRHFSNGTEYIEATEFLSILSSTGSSAGWCTTFARRTGGRNESGRKWHEQIGVHNDYVSVNANDFSEFWKTFPLNVWIDFPMTFCGLNRQPFADGKLLTKRKRHSSWKVKKLKKTVKWRRRVPSPPHRV